MAKREQDTFTVKHAETPEERVLIAREIALLKILELKLSTPTPLINMWEPAAYLYSYCEMRGVTLNTGQYCDLSTKQKINLACNLAQFAYELHTTIPVDFAQAIGFTATTWPLSTETLQQHVPNIFDEPVHADGKMRRLFEHFIEVYPRVLAKPYKPVLLHHDLHGSNIIVDQETGKLRGIIDFEDAAIGDPFQEFRLLYEIDVQLMEETAYAYAQMANLSYDVQKIHTYYLATQYSRLVEIIQGKSKHQKHSVIVELMLYEASAAL